MRSVSRQPVDLMQPKDCVSSLVWIEGIRASSKDVIYPWSYRALVRFSMRCVELLFSNAILRHP